MVSFCDKRVGFSTILNVQGQIQTATDNSNNCHYMSSHITEPEKQLEVRKSVITQVEVNMEAEVQADTTRTGENSPKKAVLARDQISSDGIKGLHFLTMDDEWVAKRL